MHQMGMIAHVKLTTNSNKQYTHDEFIKVRNVVVRVLIETYSEVSDGKGMSKLLDKAPNDVNKIKTN